MRDTDERGSVIFEWLEDARVLVINVGHRVDVPTLFAWFAPERVVLTSDFYFSNIPEVVRSVYVCLQRCPTVRAVVLTGFFRSFDIVHMFAKLPLQYEITLDGMEHLNEYRVDLAGDEEVMRQVRRT